MTDFTYALRTSATVDYRKFGPQDVAVLAAIQEHHNHHVIAPAIRTAHERGEGYGPNYEREARMRAALLR